MRVFKIDSHMTGVPDYYVLYVKWLKHYDRTGNNDSKMLAFHYARVAEELGQAIIEDEVTQELEYF